MLSKLNESLLFIPITCFGSSIIFTTSCSSSFNDNKKTNEISILDLFSEKSLREIDNFIFESSYLKQQMTKEEFKNKINQTLEINTESDFYKALTIEGDINKYNNNVKSEISETMLIEFYEFAETNSSLERHGSIFKKHFWSAVRAKAVTYGLNCLIIIDYTLPIIAAIGSFVIGDYGSLVDALTGIEGNISPTSKWLIEIGVNDVRKFKTSSNCKWKFKVWGYEIKPFK